MVGLGVEEVTHCQLSVEFIILMMCRPCLCQILEWPIFVLHSLAMFSFVGLHLVANAFQAFSFAFNSSSNMPIHSSKDFMASTSFSIFEVFIEVFTKYYKFILQQIINGSEWRLHSFHKINGAVIWSMLGQGVYNYFLKHIFEFLVLGRNFMWTWFNIWWKKNINQGCFSFCDNLYEGFYSNKQRFGAPRPSCTI